MPIAGPTTNHDEIRRWATTNNAVPAEVLPHIVDGVPSKIRLMHTAAAGDLKNVKLISWADFFSKFDQMGLAFVYDDDATGYNEIVQIDEKSPFRSPGQRPSDYAH